MPVSVQAPTEPAAINRITLVMAHERDRPQGDENDRYVFVGPLSQEGYLDPDAWRARSRACRVIRDLSDGTPSAIGRLHYGVVGGWFFRYDASSRVPDEAGYRFRDEAFVLGEQVSVRRNGREHAFRVAEVVAICR